MRRTVLTVVLGSVLLGLSACGAAQAGPGNGTKSSGTTSTPATEAPLPAGIHPSEIAKMVCASEAQHDIEEVLGDTADVSTPTWADHLYTCRYEYDNGSFALSVKELSSWSQTFAYYHSLGIKLGDKGALGNLGQGAFTTRDGSVVVRKDWKVLLVNIAGLPQEFGKPAASSGDVAFTVADVILGCWKGD